MFPIKLQGLYVKLATCYSKAQLCSVYQAQAIKPDLSLRAMYIFDIGLFEYIVYSRADKSLEARLVPKLAHLSTLCILGLICIAHSAAKFMNIYTLPKN